MSLQTEVSRELSTLMAWLSSMQEISILTWLDLSFTLDSHLAEQGIVIG